MKLTKERINKPNILYGTLSFRQKSIVWNKAKLLIPPNTKPVNNKSEWESNKPIKQRLWKPTKLLKLEQDNWIKWPKSTITKPKSSEKHLLWKDKLELPFKISLTKECLIGNNLKKNFSVKSISSNPKDNTEVLSFKRSLRNKNTTWKSEWTILKTN
jgi:hypothetical protein